MQIEKMGSGPWSAVAVDGTEISLTVGGQGQRYDCAALQANDQITLDVVLDANKALAQGVGNGVAYVATLIIPAARYAEPDLESSTEEEAGPERLPLTAADMESVRCVLWTLTETAETTEK